MPSITPAQIRGACGMLDWSKLDLAKAAHLSVSVVMHAAGRDPGRVSSESLAAIKTALEANGAEFEAADGSITVRLKDRTVSIFSRFI